MESFCTKQGRRQVSVRESKFGRKISEGCNSNSDLVAPTPVPKFSTYLCAHLYRTHSNLWLSARPARASIHPVATGQSSRELHSGSRCRSLLSILSASREVAQRTLWLLSHYTSPHHRLHPVEVSGWLPKGLGRCHLESNKSDAV